MSLLAFVMSRLSFITFKNCWLANFIDAFVLQKCISTFSFQSLKHLKVDPAVLEDFPSLASKLNELNKESNNNQHLDVEELHKEVSIQGEFIGEREWSASVCEKVTSGDVWSARTSSKLSKSFTFLLLSLSLRT